MPQDPSTMYVWRKLTTQQRSEVLQDRLQHGRPEHSLFHVTSDTTTYYLISAACYEHKPIIGSRPDRISQFERDLVDLLNRECQQIFAWTILPNHYHGLVDAADVKRLLKALGKLHGRNSFYWNGQDGLRGRQVWCNAAETAMKSEGHFYASINYVLHNAVYHGYVKKWIDWPYCNAESYLEAMGREKAERIWKAYPLYDYGKDWDPPDL